MARALLLLVFLSPPTGAAPELRRAGELLIWRDSGPPSRSFDVLFAGDGYTTADLAPGGKYWNDVARYARVLLEERPFSWYADRCSVRALLVASRERGCDPEARGDKVDTVFDSHFDSATGRILRFRNGRALTRAVARAGLPDVVFVMVNTGRYGGAGTVLHRLRVRGRPLPAPTFSARGTESFKIALHELGHSLAGLGDEYVDPTLLWRHRVPANGRDLNYPNLMLAEHLDVSDFESVRRTAKWRDLLSLPGADDHVWAHEGGYLRDHGVFRPWPRCRMRDHRDPYCPVCCRAVARAMVRACGDVWDEAAYRQAFPLRLWRP